MPGILYPPVQDYLKELVPRRDRVLREMEELALERRIPIVGPTVGQLFNVLARAHRARRVFELGSAIGYSTIWWARAVGPRGRVHFTDGDPENAELARGYLRRARVADRVTVRTGDALSLLSTTPGQFDIIFNDVDKWEYPRVLRQALPRLKVGGLLVTDNALWSGRVTEADGDEWTRAIQTYNRRVARSRKLITSVIPLRDGVSVSIKIAD